MIRQIERRNGQFPLLIDSYLSLGLIDMGHPLYAILARHRIASIICEQSEYNLEVATIVLDFIMLIQRYLDTFLFAGVDQFFYLHAHSHALEMQTISLPLQRTGKCPSSKLKEVIKFFLGFVYFVLSRVILRVFILCQEPVRLKLLS
jgi:hypothetical protein